MPRRDYTVVDIDRLRTPAKPEPTDAELAESIMRHLHPDLAAAAYHGTIDMQSRIKFVNSKFDATKRFGKGVISAAAKRNAPCRWCAADAAAKAFGEPRPHFSVPMCTLLGQPCKECIRRWTAEVARMDATLEADKRTPKPSATPAPVKPAASTTASATSTSTETLTAERHWQLAKHHAAEAQRLRNQGGRR